jgi:transcriptional regulator with XRE-family HTH domain
MTKLQSYRLQANLTQKQLSEQTGVKIGMIQKYEQRVKNINAAEVETVLKLANALHCNITDLLENL